MSYEFIGLTLFEVDVEVVELTAGESLFGLWAVDELVVIIGTSSCCISFDSHAFGTADASESISTLSPPSS